MVMAMKLITLAWNVHDGRRKAEVSHSGLLPLISGPRREPTRDKIAPCPKSPGILWVLVSEVL